MNINDRIRGIVREHEEEFQDLVNQDKALPDTFRHRVMRMSKKQAEITFEWQTPEGVHRINHGIMT
jgi:hypothetical protein